MATEGNPTLVKAFRCSDSSIAAYKFVKGDTTDTTNSQVFVTVAAASTAPVIGVTLAATTAADEDVPVAVAGIVPLEVDGSGTAIDIGDLIVPTTAGVGIKASAPSSTVQHAAAIALNPSAAAGDVINVIIARQHVTNGA